MLNSNGLVQRSSAMVKNGKAWSGEGKLKEFRKEFNHENRKSKAYFY